MCARRGPAGVCRSGGGGRRLSMRDNSPPAVGSNQFANLDCAVFYDRSEFRRSAQCALGIYVYVLDFRGIRTSAPSGVVKKMGCV